MDKISQLEGCHVLKITYGSLEEYRLQINDYRRIGREEAAARPGSGADWTFYADGYKEAVRRYDQALPTLESEIDKAVERGKLTLPNAQTIQSGQEQTNRELLQNGKGALALLSDRPVGERQWEGKNYTMSEGKDGNFRITEKSRGEILNYSNGQVKGSATPQDLDKLRNLLSVAKQTYVPQQTQLNKTATQTQTQPKVRSLSRGGAS